MTPENFCYWLQGLLELQPDLKLLDPKQVKMIREHLGYVFEHRQPLQAEVAVTDQLVELDRKEPPRNYQGFRLTGGAKIC